MLIYVGEVSEKYYYGVYNMIKMLYPQSEITRNKNDSCDLYFEFEIYNFCVAVYQNKKKILKDIPLGDTALAIKQGIYELSGKNLPFGVFTGIRPAKVILRSGDGGEKIFRDLFYADPKKVLVAAKCAGYEKKIIENTKKGEISLYIHIPFCPTRCSYCSFTAVSFSESLLNEYFEVLYFETEEVLKCLKENGFKVKTVYIGGGTPTVLSVWQLDKILSLVGLYCSNISEFTVEAGRPDTLNEEKFEVLKSGGVTRISINPQSLNEKTLAEIGRKHTAADFYNAYSLAKRKNFRCVNTDIIAGLKNESLQDFKYTFDNIFKLFPENITVHTLCEKRCAVKKEISDNYAAADMLSYAYDKLGEIYEPYYIYRQKNAVSALENTGFMRDENICAYNIIMMEEISSVAAVGAGSTSKLIDYETKKPFSKLRNDKQPQRYIATIKDIVMKKRRFLEHGRDRC